MHAKTSLHAHCMHACHHAHNLSSLDAVFDLSSNDVGDHTSDWVSAFCTIFGSEVSHGCCPCCLL